MILWDHLNTGDKYLLENCPRSPLWFDRSGPGVAPHWLGYTLVCHLPDGPIFRAMSSELCLPSYDRGYENMA